MDKKIGEKIRFRRKEMGFTLKELAGDRITPAQISAIENSKCNPSPSLLEYLCQRLEVDVEHFTLSSEQRLRHKFVEIRKECERLIERNDFKAAKLEIEKAKELFRKLDDEQKGFFCFVNGLSAYEEQEYMESFDLFVKSLAYYIRTKDRNMIADLYVKIGNSLYNTEKQDLAIGYYMNAYNMIDDGIDDDITMKIIFNIAICYGDLERPKLNKEFVEKCVAFIETHEVKRKDLFIPGIDMLKGIILMNEKENEVSMENFKEAYEKYQEENEYVGMGRAMYNLGVTSWEIGKLEDAAEYLSKAIEIKNQSGEKDVVESYVNLAKLYKEMKQLDKANEIIAVAEEKMIKCDSKEGISEVFIAKFELLCDMQDYDRAEVFAYLALDTIQKSGLKKLESTMYIKLSEMYKKLGDDRAAVENLLKANTATMCGEHEKLQNGSR